MPTSCWNTCSPTPATSPRRTVFVFTNAVRLNFSDDPRSRASASTDSFSSSISLATSSSPVYIFRRIASASSTLP